MLAETSLGTLRMAPVALASKHQVAYSLPFTGNRVVFVYGLTLFQNWTDNKYIRPFENVVVA